MCQSAQIKMQNADINLFSKKNIRLHKDRAASNVNNCALFQYAADDIMLRISMLDKSFDNILEVNARSGYIANKLLVQYPKSDIIIADCSIQNLLQSKLKQKILADDEELQFASNSFDLIVFSLGMHWINDVPKFLTCINHWLTRNGIVIANFIGGSSFKNLRKALVDAETKSAKPHARHISPFMHFDHLQPLLQMAGFKDIVIDYEQIELEYNSPFAMMKAIQTFGESCAMQQTTNYAISKNMLSILKIDTIAFHDKIELINFIASKNKNTILLQEQLL